MHGDILMYLKKEKKHLLLSPPATIVLLSIASDIWLSAPWVMFSRTHSEWFWPILASGFYCQQPSPGSPLTSMFSKTVGLFPALPDSVPWGTHSGQTLPSSSAAPGFRAVTYPPPCQSLFSFLCRPRCPCSLLLPITICLDFSLAICEYILTLKDTNSTKVALFSF